MTRKKKIVIIVVAVILVMVVSAAIWTMVIKNKKSEEEAENSEIVMWDKEGLTDSVSEEQGADVRTEESSHTGIQTTTEEEKPVAESGSTGENNRPIGGTSNNSASQMTESAATQATTTRAPGITEQPAGENPGSGNGNTHQHTWEAQYRTVHHEEEGHYEDVCVKEAYDEPVYETHNFCNYCGIDITATGVGLGHCSVCGPPYPPDHPLYGQFETQGSSYGTKDVQVGTTHHEAVYEKKWIVDKKAYDEQVLDGYKCTTCGAIKNN